MQYTVEASKEQERTIQEASPRIQYTNKQKEDWNIPAIKIMQSKIKQCKNAILK
jgi:hypothetical protein